ncbi:polynucleotide adenylyltransferase PcnB [Methylophilaceae bacterium]|jgi:poly(A) polymerase|nr:polynucleotide adenylyltransferase PcnB [Methylophilaceae bacterium]
MTSNFLNVIKKKVGAYFNPSRIDHDLISPFAIEIIETFINNKFDAFIVGGAIRDILIGQKPKDFDIATNATPEQVCSIFKKSRIIGRRFQIVHVIRHFEIIEVSTFRSPPQNKIKMKNGVFKDNEFGSIKEDAARRDFTCNALYYDPVRKKLIDFYGGIKDIQKKQLNLIGDPKIRFDEDPIRILRAIRFSAKLGMPLNRSLTDHINQSLSLLDKVPYSRLFDEIMKLFLTGHGVKSMTLFKKFLLAHKYFPALLNTDSYEFINQGLVNTDYRILNNKSINPGFLLAVFLWPDVKLVWNKKAKNIHPSTALNEAIDNILIKQSRIFPIQKRFAITMSEIWRLQPRFENLSAKRVYRLSKHPRFRAAYDFLLLRNLNDKALKNTASWWINFVEADQNKKN